MSVGGDIRTLIAGLLRRAAVPVAALSLVLMPVLAVPSVAQTSLTTDYDVNIKPGSQMLVEAEELVYDYDNDAISAVGTVKIYYVGYTLEADRVSYLKGTGKLIASGNVKMTDPSGLVVYANDIDITQDFRDGFVASLRVETPDDTYFAAESAERSEGSQTVFVNGVYTACEPCEDKPEKPPLWQVKAKRIIVDDEEKEIHFKNATFEFFGLPLAWVPYFTIADPSVKRKTGFLAPYFAYSDPLGWSVTTPYFIALAPNYDVTLTPTYFAEQGFMGDVEWRQRLANGQFTLRMAGINQENPKNFLTDTGGGTFAQEDFRGGARSTGQFALSRYWTFGWDGTISTDRTFTQNYNVLNEDVASTTSYAYLTGLRDRNYVDARVEYFEILADSTAPKYEQARQAVIAPIVDHDYILDAPVLGGELALRSNLVNLTRDESDPFLVGDQTFYHGLAGDYFRATEELEWQKKFVLPGGQLLTTFASARGDFYALNPKSDPAVVGGDLWPELTSNDAPIRFMPAVGAEWSWPVLVTAGNTSHVIEPMVQVVARPDEQFAGQLPNDDAQSLVFDDSVLFRRDKFSGYDRVEGGTRINYGVRYIGTFSNDIVLEGLFGQSQMLAGENPFAVKDIADVGAFSGLDTDTSDYVGRVSLGAPVGRLALRGRFDDADLSIQRAEVEASRSAGAFTASAAYGYIRDVPTAGIVKQSFVNASASVQIADRWRLFGSAIYTESSVTVGRGVVQIESGYTYFFDDDATSNFRAHQAPELLTRIGVLAEWFELRIGYSWAEETTHEFGVGQETLSGSNDLYLGVKIALTGQAGILPEMALMPQMFVPSGSSDLTAGETLPGLNWLYGWDVTDFVSMGGQTQVNRRLDDETGRPFAEFSQSWTINYSLADRLGGYTEWFCFAPDGADSNHNENYFDGGFTFLLTDNVQLDARGGVGLNEAAVDLFTGVGLSIRLY